MNNFKLFYILVKFLLSNICILALIGYDYWINMSKVYNLDSDIPYFAGSWCTPLMYSLLLCAFYVFFMWFFSLIKRDIIEDYKSIKPLK